MIFNLHVACIKAYKAYKLKMTRNFVVYQEVYSLTRIARQRSARSLMPLLSIEYLIQRYATHTLSLGGKSWVGKSAIGCIANMPQISNESRFTRFSVVVSAC